MSCIDENMLKISLKKITTEYISSGELIIYLEFNNI